MNDKIATVLAVLFFAALFGFPITLCIVIYINTDQTIMEEGEVIDLKIQDSGHFLGGNEYYLQLNNTKWYEIYKADYYKINIGDYVIIYLSKRVEVKGS